ncbi:right-handed parallel beta-helix repeat-containing protein [Streptomyces fulvoviolaceus]|uniref:right-handed parallel beta-helix repeat-containing protein n=1 Tax=Streptomyces fulvoviolaceus TaxID=285535 RepID=UPI0021BEDC28|nr:right-handed parallel beta-helix repeat-containing protein [Streptomyces fulvoviolaceus]MCT9077484.1 right-handed parallel beta-helix repeat-containing protein [Streptomyces fulvoviolaceus]
MAEVRAGAERGWRRWTRAGLIVSTVLAAAWAVPPTASAAGDRQELYVAPWGNDTWPGTIERPFATPARAQQAVRDRTAGMTSDIVVNLRGGTYRLAAPLRMAGGDSGRGGHRVVYQAYGFGTSYEEQVTLSGGRPVTGWRPDPGRDGVWRADVGDLDTRQLYVDGRRSARASLGSGLPGKVKVTAGGYTTTSRIPLSWDNPSDLELLYRFDYVEGRCGVAGVSRGPGNRTTITMDQPCWKLARDLYGKESLGAPTEVENSPDFLQRTGSWYLDRSRAGHHELLYRPTPGQDMRRTPVVAPELETLLGGTGVHDIAFRGLTFADATWLAPNEPAGFVAAWSMYMRRGKGGEMTALTVPGNVAFRTAERITFQGNRFTRLGAQGLEFSANSSHNTVDGNVFTDISDGGVVLGVLPPDASGTNRGNRITDNWIHHIAAEYHAASGIWDAGSQDTLIGHNQVDHVPYTGILSGPSEDLRGLMHRNRIVGNRVFATNRLLVDGGGIYLRGEQGTSYADGAVVSGNAVTDSRYGIWNVGIYTDDSSKWITVRRNVVHNYRASIGGCSEEWGNRPVRNVRYHGNFWDDAVPDWLARRDYPGAWPPAPDCGNPHDLEFKANTLLPPAHPAAACAARSTCAGILDRAGPRAARWGSAMAR